LQGLMQGEGWRVLMWGVKTVCPGLRAG
jgi:hypothetical protein